MTAVPRHIEVLPGTVSIRWDDGLESSLPASTLRAACPCAACRSPEGARRTAAVLDGLMAVTIHETRIVGGYALSFDFGPDAHRSGIFPYSLLRSLPTDAT